MHGLRNQVRKTGSAMKTFLPSAPSISAASCLLGVWIAGAAGTVMSANAADSWNVLPALKVILAQSPEIGLFQKYSGQIAVSSVVMGLAIFVVWTIYRRHHEAEARTLTGSYISDGVEATWIKFPDLLTMGADIRAPKALAVLASIAEEQNEEFYGWAKRNISSMRKLLPKFESNADVPGLQPALSELAATLDAFKSRTSKPELRPAWQLAFVLELLVSRLRERPAEITLSTVRTIASSLDVLAAACLPGVRSDLIVEPPISILAVDDDPLCLRAITFALRKTGITPDTAVDGNDAVNKCSEKIYDVVFMDIMMPGMDGLEACKRLRSDANNANTPVVFVTARSDFQTRERSVEVGGAELIGKPFLVTELTVKAVAFCMRKRLNLPLSSLSALAENAVAGEAHSLPSAAGIRTAA